MKRIAIITSTRADWGLLQPVASRLRENKDVELIIVATNMHLDPQRGMTVGEIEADGFKVDYRVDMNVDNEVLQPDSPLAASKSAARCLSGVAEVFDESRPDIALILGDRFEMLAVALGATLFNIPVAHISGGEITTGAFDDNIRHAISKLSSLHFATTETHRQRLISMGERPDRVFNVGALGVYNILNVPLLSREELEKSLGFGLSDNTLLVTYHPATNDTESPAKRFESLLSALDRFDNRILFTYPNNDPRSQRIIELIQSYCAAHPDRAVAVPSLGRLRYLSALQFVRVVVGNSSSGIVEVPSAGIPTVDIGIRQNGRTCGPSVIHCGDSTDEISRALTVALSPDFRKTAASKVNPYRKNNTPDEIVATLLKTDYSTLIPKIFYDKNPSA